MDLDVDSHASPVRAGTSTDRHHTAIHAVPPDETGTSSVCDGNAQYPRILTNYAGMSEGPISRSQRSPRSEILSSTEVYLWAIFPVPARFNRRHLRRATTSVIYETPRGIALRDKDYAENRASRAGPRTPPPVASRIRPIIKARMTTSAVAQDFWYGRWGG